METPANDNQPAGECAAATDAIDDDQGSDEEAPIEATLCETAARSESTLEESILRGGRQVQHAGAWIVIAMLQTFGLYDVAERLRKDSGDAAALRLSLDAAAIALTLGQRTVEGVRRLATPSVATLLRSSGAVSATWVRRVLARFATKGATILHLAMAKTLAERARAERNDGRIVLYVDNHMRPYTGKLTVRKGWRMQDKRALPGTSEVDPTFRTSG